VYLYGNVSCCAGDANNAGDNADVSRTIKQLGHTDDQINAHASTHKHRKKIIPVTKNPIY